MSSVVKVQYLKTSNET